ncbi:MAG: TlpA family protein disulfide reductase [Acidimicrobiales bacterium]|nr:TlpA family protein disulfide reductase [Acidimicrobiales bacterium]HRW36394.1 TlpA disulfide reductase family protein [Aquihabitans sp.]
MADAAEPPAEAADDPVDAPVDADVEQPHPVNHQPGAPRRRSALRRLDRRTVAICALIALVASLLAAFAFTLIVGDDDATPSGTLDLSEQADTASTIDADRLLAVRVETDDGEATTLDQLRGDGRTLVNFWQSSCVPCVKEMPLLQQGSEANPDVAFLGANVQETDPDAAVEMLASTGVTYPSFEDPDGDLYAETKVPGLPATILLDADGSVLGTHVGAFASEVDLQAFLDSGGS